MSLPQSSPASGLVEEVSPWQFAGLAGLLLGSTLCQMMHARVWGWTPLLHVRRSGQGATLCLSRKVG